MYIAVHRRAAKLGRLAVAVLLLVAFLSNSLVFAQAANGDATYSFAISDTRFSVTPGAEPYVSSTTSGAVEIATEAGAVIWANLGGAGALDAVVLSGLTAVLLSELLGALLERITGAVHAHAEIRGGQQVLVRTDRERGKDE